MMNTKNTIHATLLTGLLMLAACTSHSAKESDYTLQSTQESLSFTLSPHCTAYIKSLSLFDDSLGNKYVAFMSNDEPEIYLYDRNTSRLAKTIRYHREGPDGVGPKAGGFLMNGYQEIYLPNLFTPEISQIDSSGHKLATLRLEASPQAFPAIPTRTVIGLPMFQMDQALYCPQLPNPRLGEKKQTDSPIYLHVNLKTTEVQPARFCYPPEASPSGQAPALGIESRLSCCYNGSHFVGSFAFDDHLYVFSKDFQLIQKVQASSRYLEHVSLPESVPTDLNQDVKMMCELPCYGDLIYDEYRQLYYRIAYPKESLEKGESLSDLMQSGRTRFSVLILDKDLNVKGETMLPDNQYRSNLYFVDEKGLYFSTNHYRNPHYDEDELCFERFVVNR